jgi:hypothetical protein
LVPRFLTSTSTSTIWGLVCPVPVSTALRVGGIKDHIRTQGR